MAGYLFDLIIIIYRLVAYCVCVSVFRRVVIVIIAIHKGRERHFFFGTKISSFIGRIHHFIAAPRGGTFSCSCSPLRSLPSSTSSPPQSCVLNMIKRCAPWIESSFQRKKNIAIEASERKWSHKLQQQRRGRRRRPHSLVFGLLYATASVLVSLSLNDVTICIIIVEASSSFKNKIIKNLL